MRLTHESLFLSSFSSLSLALSFFISLCFFLYFPLSLPLFLPFSCGPQVLLVLFFFLLHHLLQHFTEICKYVLQIRSLKPSPFIRFRQIGALISIKNEKFYINPFKTQRKLIVSDLDKSIASSATKLS